jgi:putative membrane protein
MATTALTPARTLARRLPVVLAVATVLAQVAYPRVSGPARNGLTIATVLLFAAATLTSAVVERGVRWALLLLAVTAGGGLVVEAVGVSTGIPFGAYAYADTLGWKVAGVPLVIPLAWTMMAYPALVVGRQITARRWLGPVVAGAALASWDLFLDPQMVAAGHWTWEQEGAPALLGVPLTNFAGWFVVATAMMAVLWPTVPPGPADERVPLALYLWTYASSVLAHAVYLGLPGSALAGGVGMGAVVLTWALRRR